MYTERHNRAGRIFLRAISKGSLGNNLVMADVGRAEKCLAAGAPALHCNHIPASLIPCKRGATREERLQHAALLRKLKPDALMVSRGRGKNDTSVKIIEIKYCIDTKPDDQLQRAKEQHLDLVQQLTAHGYLADKITIIPLLIGVSGTIYKKHTQEALKSLGVAHTQVKTCVSKAHKEAIKSLHDIVQTRRHIEHTSNSKGKPPRPP
jgi:hypothetical protein